jgi:hypothetical protein
MTTHRLLTFLVMLALLAGPSQAGAQPGLAPSPAAPIGSLGTGFTYQGRLTTASGPVDGNCDFQFGLWDALAGGAQLGVTQTVSSLAVNAGLFTATLNDAGQFGGSAFDGQARWLGIAVRCPAGGGTFTPLTPRQALTAAPYAHHALSAGTAATTPWSGLTGVPTGFADNLDDDTTYSAGTGLTLLGATFAISSTYQLPQGCIAGKIPEWTGSLWVCADDDTAGSGSFWSLTGNAGTTSSHFVGTTDNMTLTLAVNGTTALRLVPTAGEPNVLGGAASNAASATAGGVTIGGGAWNTVGINGNYATIAGGISNTASDDYSTVGGGTSNTASGGYATIAGGGSNTASGAAATIAGGSVNTASGANATVGGGSWNTASHSGATVSGGGTNTASGANATVGGGHGNTASGGGATVSGGGQNTASGDYDTVSGGYGNTIAITNTHAAIGGGDGNTVGINGYYATIAGGADNAASGWAAAVGGGTENTATGYVATVSGGAANTASGAGATVGGGGWDGSVTGGNAAYGAASTIGGGLGNTVPITGTYATIGGGDSNTASGERATVGGGGTNTASDMYSTVGGGTGNIASDEYSTVGGGTGNTASDMYSTVGGGTGNTAGGFVATVGGGMFNFADDYDTVGGGRDNTARGGGSTVGGGRENTAHGSYATVGGGETNIARSDYTTVGGGEYNDASGDYAAVGGGGNNAAGGNYATVGGGADNTATGYAATVPGGYSNNASGDYSFAAGQNARAAHDGVFVWADSSTDVPIGSTAANQFLVRATGGISLTTNITGTTGCSLSAGGGTWDCTSDRSAKANFAPVDGVTVLQALMGVPIETWNFSTQAADIRHIGPTAQDFQAAFGLGEGPTTISAVDADGVALAAIQGLYHVVQAQDAEIAALTERVAALEAEAAPASTASTLQLVVVLLVGLAAGAVLGLGAYALGRARRG